jgi:hypothetical protein
VYCSVLYCVMLCCVALYCVVLSCPVLYCTLLCCVVLYCPVLYCSVMSSTVRRCTALVCTILLSTRSIVTVPCHLLYRTRTLTRTLLYRLPMPLHDGLMLVVVDVNRILESFCSPVKSGQKQSAHTLKCIKVRLLALVVIK